MFKKILPAIFILLAATVIHYQRNKAPCTSSAFMYRGDDPNDPNNYIPPAPEVNCKYEYEINYVGTDGIDQPSTPEQLNNYISSNQPPAPAPLCSIVAR